MHELHQTVGPSPNATGSRSLLHEGADGAPPGLEIKKGGLGSVAQIPARSALLAVPFLTLLDTTIVSVGLADVS